RRHDAHPQGNAGAGHSARAVEPLGLDVLALRAVRVAAPAAPLSGEDHARGRRADCTGGRESGCVAKRGGRATDKTMRSPQSPGGWEATSQAARRLSALQRTRPRRSRLTIASRMTAPRNETPSPARLTSP